MIASVPGPTDVTIVDVAAVLPDRIVEPATVIVREGLIADVVEGAARSGTDVVDGAGAYCIPGVVDTHSDGLEKELRPRPGVLLPIEFALRSFEGRVRAAGVTTIYHGIGYENTDKYDRSVDQAKRITTQIDALAASETALIDHRVLHRLDVRDADGLDALADRIASAPADHPPLVSYEDHTPGIGQYADRTGFERYVAGTRGLDPDEARRYIDRYLEERDAQLGNRARAMPWLTEQARRGTLRLMAHDPANVADVEEADVAGAAIAEFPTTVDAAREARARGLRTVCGGPNALRGTSHSGNVSARELIALGLCDGLASDYLPSTLLGAVGIMVHDGALDLPTAIGLVTSGPAATVGLVDRGRIEPGLRADLALVRFHGRVPAVEAVLCQAASVDAGSPRDLVSDTTPRVTSAGARREFFEEMP